MSDDGRTFLTAKQAIAMLPEGDYVHTFRDGIGMLIGADWSRKDLIKAIKKAKPELAGEMATNMKHGLVIFDDHGPLFIQTKENHEDISARKAVE